MLGGLLALTTFDFEGELAGFVPLVKESTIRFRRPALGVVRASASLSAPEAARVRADALATGKGEFVLEATLTDAQGEVVASTVGTYQVRRRNFSGPARRSTPVIDRKVRKSAGGRRARTRPTRPRPRADRAGLRRRAPGVAARAAAVDGAPRVRQRRPTTRRRSTRPASTRDDLTDLADLAQVPFTTKETLRQNYPFGMFAVPRDRRRPRARLERHDRQAHRRGLHPWRPRRVGHRGRAQHPGGRRPAGGHPAQRLRLRAVHRRARRPRRRREARLHGRARLRRDDRAPGAADRRLPARRDHGDAVLHAQHRRRDGAPGPRPAGQLAAGRHLRRRAVDQRDAHRGGGAPRHARRRHLRPVRDHRPGRGAGVRGDQGRPARLGGPLLPGDHRPGHRRGAARRRGGRAGADLADQGGHAGPALPHPRPDPPAARARCVRCAGSRRSPAAPTT